MFLNFTLDIGASRIGLIPDFLGYIFMLRGLAEITDLSTRFSKVVPAAKVMVAYSSVIWVLEFLGVLTNVELVGGIGAGAALLSNPLLIIAGLISTVLSLYISYNIIMGIMDIERDRGQDLATAKLYSTWKAMLVLILATNLLIIIPMLAIVAVIASFVVAIVYLVAFNRTKNLFYMQ
ncbi:MAG: hypothetical protein FWB75_03910 [Oscillospiraceae bacterium]|nr:hypothetical protein [Oscillospiraceae bacterium]